MGTSTTQPDSVTLTIGTNLLLLVAGCCARNSMPPLAVAHHLLVMAFSPECSGGQLATACVSGHCTQDDPRGLRWGLSLDEQQGPNP